MNEHDPTPRDAAPDEEAEVRRLLERAGPRPPVPPEDLAAITAAARSAWRREVEKRSDRGAPADVEPRRRPAWAMPLALAAMVVLGVGLAWWWSRGAGAAMEVARAEWVTGTTTVETGSGALRTLAGGEAIPAGATLITAAGTDTEDDARASLRLADGTVVRLDAGTRVRFDSPAALALERGAVYADSGDRGAGLTVSTAAGTASDVGTRFTVRLIDPARPTLEVRVRDGGVAVESAGRRWMAPAGEELVVGPTGEPVRRSIDPWGPEWEWVLDAAAGYRIEGRTLGELLAWVTRETGWTVRWADPALEARAPAIVLRGDLGGLRPDQAPFAVLPGAGLQGELAEDAAGSRELLIRERQNS